MSSRAEALKAKAERIRQQKEAASKPPTTPPTAVDERTPEDRERALATASNPHVKNIRSTVDLPPARHAQLKAWLGETAVMIGRSRVTTQDVVRTMVDRLLTDETFARKIRDDLRASD